MRMRIHHHVYTSLDGYRTVYASAGLATETRDVLERFSRRAYTHIRGAPLHCLMRFEDGAVCQSRIFPAGADQGGRARTAVHNIYITADEAQRFPSVNHLELQLPFLEPDATFRALAGSLPTHVQIGRQADVAESLSLLAREAPQAAIIFHAMLSTGHRFVVHDPQERVRRIMQGLYVLLPPAERLRLNIVRGGVLPQLADGTGPIHVTLLPRRELLSAASLPDENVQMDFADWSAPVVRNQPAANAYATYVTRMSSDPDGAETVERLLALLWRHGPRHVQTHDIPANYVAAFQRVASAVTPQGALDGQGLRDLFPAGLDTIMPFWHAGMTDLALEVLLSNADVLQEQRNPDQLPALRQRLEHLRRLPADDRLPFADFVVLATDEIRRLARAPEGAPASQPPNPGLAPEQLIWDDEDTATVALETQVPSDSLLIDLPPRGDDAELPGKEDEATEGEAAGETPGPGGKPPPDFEQYEGFM